MGLGSIQLPSATSSELASQLQAQQEHPEQGVLGPPHPCVGWQEGAVSWACCWDSCCRTAALLLPAVPKLALYLAWVGLHWSEDSQGSTWPWLFLRTGGTLQGFEKFPALPRMCLLQLSPLWPALLQVGSGEAFLFPPPEQRSACLSRAALQSSAPSPAYKVFCLWSDTAFKEILLVKSDMMDVLAQHNCKCPWVSWKSFCLQLSEHNTNPSPNPCLEVVHDT